MSKSWKWNVKLILLILSNFVIGFNFMLRINQTDSIRHLLTSSLICSYILVFIVNEIETNKVYFRIGIKLIDCLTLKQFEWKHVKTFT